MLKKMNEKKNNKGFSLVELIVVILIMAVLAVAIAPQVMKWVKNAQIAQDKQNADTIVSSAQLAAASTKNDSNFSFASAGNDADFVITSLPSTFKNEMDTLLGSGWEDKLAPKSNFDCTITVSGVAVGASGTLITEDIN